VGLRCLDRWFAETDGTGSFEGPITDFISEEDAWTVLADAYFGLTNTRQKTPNLLEKIRYNVAVTYYLCLLETTGHKFFGDSNLDSTGFGCPS